MTALLYLHIHYKKKKLSALALSLDQLRKANQLTQSFYYAKGTTRNVLSHLAVTASRTGTRSQSESWPAATHNWPVLGLFRKHQFVCQTKQKTTPKILIWTSKVYILQNLDLQRCMYILQFQRTRLQSCLYIWTNFPSFPTMQSISFPKSWCGWKKGPQRPMTLFSLLHQGFQTVLQVW